MDLKKLFDSLVSQARVEHPETVAGETPFETEAMICVGDVYSLLLVPAADQAVSRATLAPATIRHSDPVAPFLR